MENTYKYFKTAFDLQDEFVHDGEINNTIETSLEKIQKVLGAEIQKFQIDKAYVKKLSNGRTGIYIEGSIWVDIWYKTHLHSKLIKHKAQFIDVIILSSESLENEAGKEVIARFINKPEIIEIITDSSITPTINISLEYLLAVRLGKDKFQETTSLENTKIDNKKATLKKNVKKNLQKKLEKLEDSNNFKLDF